MTTDKFMTGYNTGFWHSILTISCIIMLIGIVNIMTNLTSYETFIFKEIYIFSLLATGFLLGTIITIILAYYDVFKEEEK